NFSSRPSASTKTHTLSLHDALPISVDKESLVLPFEVDFAVPQQDVGHHGTTSARSSATACRSAEAAASISSGVVKRYRLNRRVEDRKSTRLNSSHVSISYAVFCS